jgi:phage tail sheath protein FI
MPVQTSYPGVYIEERPSGVRTIVGVATSVTAFVGVARMGPVDTPVRVTSLPDYVRVFGSPMDADSPMGHCVSHFFGNGGAEAVIVRILATDATFATADLPDATPAAVLVLTAIGKGEWANRVAGTGLEVAVDRAGSSNPDDLFNLTIRQFAIDPRTNASVEVAAELHRNLSMSPAHTRYALKALASSRLATAALASPAPTSAATGSSVGAGEVADPLTISSANNRLLVSVDHGPAVEVTLFPGEVVGGASVSKNPTQIATELRNNALPNAGLNATASVSNRVITISSATPGLDSAVAVTPGPGGDAAQALQLGLLFGGTEVSGSAAVRPADTGATPIAFDGGDDGSPVSAPDFTPTGGTGGMYSLGQRLFPRFNLLCLPGVTSDDDLQLQAALSYCEDERAVLLVDTPPGWTTDPPDLGGLPAFGQHGAIYYPRLRLVERAVDGSSTTLDLPPCGAVAGTIARIDTTRGVWKAPAGLEAGLIGFNELTVPTDDALSGLLNPQGVNVLRTFPGAGTVVWGARTLKGADSQASEFKYLPVRRLTNHIASSLYIGTQFAVFEPNDPDLWGQLRLAVGTFMRTLFRQGAFQQSEQRSESDSFFVTCDASVNPQSEIDLGRVNVIVGFAPLKPAEFVIVTITQISQLEE